jgi:hypothetical protein
MLFCSSSVSVTGDQVDLELQTVAKKNTKVLSPVNAHVNDDRAVGMILIRHTRRIHTAESGSRMILPHHHACQSWRASERGHVIPPHATLSDLRRTDRRSEVWQRTIAAATTQCAHS